MSVITINFSDKTCSIQGNPSYNFTQISYFERPTNTEHSWLNNLEPYKENMFWNILCSYRKYNNESAQIRKDICKEMKVMAMDVLDYLMTTYDLAPNQLMLLYLRCTDEFYKKLVKMVAIKRIGLHE